MEIQVTGLLQYERKISIYMHDCHCFIGGKTKGNVLSSKAESFNSGTKN